MVNFLNKLTDRLLQAVWNVTGFPWASKLLWERQCRARWEAACAEHIARGGVVMTLASDAGEQSILIAA
jgi:hypothetical protein